MLLVCDGGGCLRDAEMVKKGYDLLGHIPLRVLYDGVWLLVFEVAFSTEVRLQEAAIDLLEVDGLGRSRMASIKEAMPESVS